MPVEWDPSDSSGVMRALYAVFSVSCVSHFRADAVGKFKQGASNV